MLVCFPLELHRFSVNTTQIFQFIDLKIQLNFSKPSSGVLENLPRRVYGAVGPGIRGLMNSVTSIQSR